MSNADPHFNTGGSITIPVGMHVSTLNRIMLHLNRSTCCPKVFPVRHCPVMIKLWPLIDRLTVS